MGRRSGYTHGTFSWADLTTTDVDGAKAFYGRLFRWTPEDVPGAAGTYTMLHLDGDVVAGLFGQSEEQRAAGVPPRWLCYVTVDRIEEVTGRVTELGGTVVNEVFDVEDAGRMALIADPGGARLALWESRANIGATRVNDPGCLCWNDLVTADVDGAARFYAGLFRWETQEIPGAGGYRVIRNAERTNGGMMPAAMAGWQGTGYWLPYFNAGELDAASAVIGDTGGRVVIPAQTVPAGRFAVATDPQGAPFALFEGEVDD
jgi:predicted enzyme related to lactoylglutathione lyase